MAYKLPLPRGWKRRVRSSVIHILALGHFHLLEQRTFARRTNQYTCTPSRLLYPKSNIAQAATPLGILDLTRAQVRSYLVADNEWNSWR